MMIDDPDYFGLFHSVNSLGIAAVIHKDKLFAICLIHDCRRSNTKAFQYIFRFLIYLPADNRKGIHTCLPQQICICDC